MIADKPTRLANFIIDIAVITIITSLLKGSFMMFDIALPVNFYIVYFLYYFLFEAIGQTTIGKLCTKTKVTLTKRRNRIWWFFVRTILRFNPLDAHSYVFGKEYGAHDVVSRTKVVKSNK